MAAPKVPTPSTLRERGPLVGRLPARALPKLGSPLLTPQSEAPSLSEALSAQFRTRSELRHRGNRTRSPRDFREWSLAVPEPKAGRLDFERFPFQSVLYTDASAREPELVIVKPTQVGVSAYLVRWVLFWSDTEGATGLYVFPKAKQIYDFCQSGDTQVLMGDGSLRALKDVAAGDRVLSADADGAVVEDVVVRTCSPGSKDLLRVRLALGRVVRCTAEHRLMTKRGWVQAGALLGTDEVAVPRSLPEPPPNDDGVTTDDAFIAALWLAEGGKTAAGFNFTCGNGEVRERAQQIAARRGWDFYVGDRLYVGLTMKTNRGPESPSGFLREFGLRGMRTNSIRVPDRIMRAPRPVVEEFFRTYLACDGHVGAREITASSASERMMRDLQVLAARLGIAGSVRSFQPHAYVPGRERKAGMRAWTFAVATQSERAKILRMGVPGKAVATSAVDPQDAALRLYVDLGGDDPAVLGALARPQGGQVGWAKVVSVEPDGHEPVFDFETASTHAYLVEGALTHNSDARVTTIIRKSALAGRVRGVDNKGYKQVGLGDIYFRGSESEDDLNSVDADCLALDEYDSLMPVNIPVAERRVSGPNSLGLMRRVGVPSYPNVGISRLYAQSDQQRWTVKCGRCGEWQVMTWGSNVDTEAFLRVCASCRKPLDPDWIRDGQWVSQNGAANAVPGYKLSKLDVPYLSETQMRALVGSSLKTLPEDRQAFWNRDMGEPYAPAEGRITDGALDAAMSLGEATGSTAVAEGYSGENYVTMGCCPAGTEIRMADGGVVAIENVVAGDEVVTHHGDQARVTATMVREHHGPIREVSVYGQAQRLSLTDEHPVWTKRGWVVAGELRVGDMVLTPRLTRDEGVAPLALAKVLGYYLAEGNINRRNDDRYSRWRGQGGYPFGIEWNFNRNEHDLMDDLRTALGGLGYKMQGPYVRERKSGWSCRVCCGSPLLARRLMALGGEKSWSKRLAPEVLGWGVAAQAALVQAYLDGDGCFTRGGQRVQAGSVSRELADGIHTLALRCGIRMTPPTKQFSPSARKRCVRPKYVLQASFSPAPREDARCALGDDGLWRRVMSLADVAFDGLVYNFDVEGDHSYVANYVAVHNCDTASARSLNVRVSEHLPQGGKRALFVGLVPDFNELARMIARFRCHMVGIDAGPEGRLAQGIANQFPGRVYTVRYNDKILDVMKLDEERHEVMVRKTETVDAMLDGIRQSVNALPPDAPADYRAQLQNLLRVVEKNSRGQRVARYAHNGDVDYAMAETYDLVAETLLRLRIGVDEALGQEYARLEDSLELERSVLHSDADTAYVEGPNDVVYSPDPGPDEEYGG